MPFIWPQNSHICMEAGSCSISCMSEKKIIRSREWVKSLFINRNMCGHAGTYSHSHIQVCMCSIKDGLHTWRHSWFKTCGIRWIGRSALPPVCHSACHSQAIKDPREQSHAMQLGCLFSLSFLSSYRSSMAFLSLSLQYVSVHSDTLAAMYYWKVISSLTVHHSLPGSSR